MRASTSRFGRVLPLCVLAILSLGAALAPLIPDVVPPRVARAAMRTVTNANDSGLGSLRAALASATAGDSITFSLPPSSTITLSSPLLVTSSVTIDGSAVSNLTVSGNNATRVFNVSAPSTIASLTIANGRATSSGGGLLATNALTLTNVNVISNTTTVSGPTEGGGGLFATSALTLTNVNVISNTATNSAGAGIRASGPTRITGGSFRGNRTISSGGGLMAGATLTVSNTTFISNTASTGGGLYLGLTPGGVPNSTVEGSLFQDNNGSFEGGAMFIYGASNFRLLASRLIGNRAGEGGGIYFAGGTAHLDNNVLAANTATSEAADIGIGNPVSSVAARHTTFAAAIPGQGLAVSAGDTSGDTMILTNTIFSDYAVALRTGPQAATIIATGVLWSNVTTQTQRLAGSIAVTIAFTGTAGFVNPAAGDYHLLDTSAAIDRGVVTSLAVDIDGQTRPQGSAPDLGADETVPSYKQYLPVVYRQ